MKRIILALTLTLLLSSAAPCAAITVQGNIVGEPSNSNGAIPYIAGDYPGSLWYTMLGLLGFGA